MFAWLSEIVSASRAVDRFLNGCRKVKIFWVPVVIGGHNLPSPVGIGLTDLLKMGGASGTPGFGTRFEVP